MAHTPEQDRVLASIRGLTRGGVPPSYGQIGEQLGKTRSQVCMILRRMRDRGLIDFEDGRARTLRIIGEIEGLEGRSTPDLQALRRNIDRILTERAA